MSICQLVFVSLLTPSHASQYPHHDRAQWAARFAEMRVTFRQRVSDKVVTILQEKAGKEAAAVAPPEVAPSVRTAPGVELDPTSAQTPDVPAAPKEQHDGPANELATHETSSVRLLVL